MQYFKKEPNTFLRQEDMLLTRYLQTCADVYHVENNTGGRQGRQGGVLPQAQRYQEAGAGQALRGAQGIWSPGEDHGEAQEEECSKGPSLCAIRQTCKCGLIAHMFLYKCSALPSLATLGLTT